MTTMQKKFFNVQTEGLLMGKETAVRLLREANANFVESFDASQGRWELNIKTDIDGEVLSVEYDNQERFVSLGICFVSSLDALVDTLVSATFAASQFSYISYYRGETVFPASEFKYNISGEKTSA